MSAGIFDYAAILADLEAKRAALDSAIASIRSAIALGTVGQAGELPPGSTSNGPVSFHGDEIPAGAFLGKSLPEATRLYLSIVKKKKTTAEIAQALKEGGIESTSKNFQTILHSGLIRVSKQPNSPLAKLGRSHWGLTEWYPAGIRSAVSPKKAITKKKGRKSKVQVADESVPRALPAPKKSDELKEKILQALRGVQEITSPEMARKTGEKTGTVNLAFARLVKANLVRMTAPGTYSLLAQTAATD